MPSLQKLKRSIFTALRVSDPETSFAELPKLPVELIEAILDYLHDDHEALKACCLVWKYWTHPARRRLFTTRWTLDLRQLPDRLPVVLPFLRHLRIRCPDYSQSWDSDLPLLVGHNHLQSLHLFCPSGFHMPTIRTPSTFSHNFSGVVTLRLERILFSDVSALLEIVCGFPRLQTLSITKGSIEKYKPPLTTFQPSADLIAMELDILGMDEILQWFLKLAALPSFLSVCLYHNPTMNLDPRHKFITALNSSVEHLSFPIYGSSCHSINLSHLTQLRSIRFHMIDAGLVNVLPSFLSNLPSPHLEMVAFYLYNGDWRYSNPVRWREVDALLQCSPFDGLKEVCLDSTQRLATPFIDPLSCYMPQCRARGILRICEPRTKLGFGGLF